MWKIIAIMIILLSGCTSQSNTLKEGKYVLFDSEQKEWAWVILEKDNQFEFNRSMATSYRPTGTYKIEENILILFINDDETYRFNIKDDQLIFLDGDYASDIVEVGSVFTYNQD